MRIRKLLTLTGFILIIASTQVYSQYYQSGVGLRLGNASGITAKAQLGSHTYIEGLLTVRWDGFNVTALGELARPFPDTPGLNWYYGIGASLGFWDDPANSDDGTELNIGAVTIIGMEYTFEEVPINLAIDWKPYFIVLTSPRFEFDEFALSVRYVISRR